MIDVNDSSARTAIEALPKASQSKTSGWLEQLPADVVSAVTQDGARPVGLGELLRVGSASEYAAELIAQRSDAFVAMCRSGALTEPLRRSALAARCQAVLDSGFERGDFMRALRSLRHETLLKILWRDWIVRVELSETLAALSDLAECAIGTAVEYAERELRSRYGDVVVAGARMPLVVLAMGKLGGRELNFSSDIDLVFTYVEDGSTDGAKSISAHEYFTRIARSTVALLEEVTADGFVYRVDTRLRPFGDSGPPVASFASLESYLQQHGRDWERYAYVKARVVHPVDSPDAVTPLVEQIIRPFVYRRYLDFGVFAALREMHAMVANEVRRRDLAANIKLGPGGIREIEFIVQALQLVRGGSVPRLQTTELATALRQAVEQREFGARDGALLRDAYDLLRRVENALQAFRDQQTHELPTDAADRARLAYALRVSGWDELEARLNEARAEVSRQFARIAERDAEDDAEGEDTADFRQLWAQQAPALEWRGAFERHGVAGAESLAESVAAFSANGALRHMHATAAARLAHFMPHMLRALGGVSEPASTLRRVLRVVERILRRSAYLALLNENRRALTRLVELCARSQYLAAELASFPALLDELIDTTRYKQLPLARDLAAELAARLAALDTDDVERCVETLAEFKRAVQFRVAVADICGELPLMKVSDCLTTIAELILAKALDLATAELVRKFGQPRYRFDGHSYAASLGVVAYGKLGGMELSYGSDLDLVFLHDSRGDAQQTDGEKPIDNSVFFARLARRLVHFLTTQTGSGALYAIDTRLRPSGRSGLLVTTIEAFERYQNEAAWTWEHQALLRARAVAGSAIAAREFERIRAAVLRRPVDASALVEDVRAMRKKMAGELDQSTATHFDVKQGRGGITDIEFLVQYLVLLNAAQHPAVIHYTDNIRQLGALSSAGCLRLTTCEFLQQTYRQYRAALHGLALNRAAPVVANHRFAAQRDEVMALWQRTFGADNSS